MAKGDLHRAFVGLGGNQAGPLGGPRDYIEAAVERLAALQGIEVLRRSRLYRSAPWGHADQSDFTNAVLELETGLPARTLLDRLLEVERQLGRERQEHQAQWGPRLIDLDLLAFDDAETHSEALNLPHPRMHQRAFVLVPLLELEPDFEIPGRGRADQCLAAIGDEQRVDPL